ncbi:hypothetical protein COV11_03170 [Candidatus Woesearchaeota archaeon CG10_big_fil_rev_8_21_14_0_10_30_7]|nr:MAG: hypothetical protein COV11_03170 [Candidatus Woesearchaeota archaeon CG10_big_fil_rev_8_21_14_0_10_30_7]
MYIDDLLKQDKFKELDTFLSEEMHKYAGNDLVKQMLKIWESEASARNWFYSKIIALGNKRPYDFCKEGKIKEVSNLLGRIEHGVYS